MAASPSGTITAATALHHYAGLNFGTRLIEACEQLAVSRGRHLVAMGAADDNPDALRLYERLGYQPTGKFDITEYTWVAEDGTRHHARERDQLLLKHLHVTGQPRP